MYCNLGEPGRKEGSAFKLSKMLKGACICILNNVFRLVLVLNDRSDNTIQAPVVASNDHLIQVVLACQYPPHEIGIAQRIRLRFQGVQPLPYTERQPSKK